MGLVINDVGERNIDARLVADLRVEASSGWEELVALTDGCICCSLREDLLEGITSLAASARYDLILIESTGMADPQSIVRTFYSRAITGSRPTEHAYLQSLITVVDVEGFWSLWTTLQSHRQRRESTGEEDALFELLLHQVECADLLVLNKIDRFAHSAFLGAVESLPAMLRGLNPRATVYPTSYGRIEASKILDAQRFDPAQTLEAAGWLQLLDGHHRSPTEDSHAHDHDHHHDHHHDHDHPTMEQKYALETFVYEARSPFDDEKLLELFREGWPGLLRAKGFVGQLRSQTKVWLFSLVGQTHSLEQMGTWWATRIDSGQVSPQRLPAAVRDSWDAQVGDRRQELVFLGMSIQPPKLQQSLDRCLVR